MSEREKMIELIGQAKAMEASGIDCKVSDEYVADYIIADGWIRPPCNVGDKVWLIKSLNLQQTEWEIKEGEISMIQQKADKSWKFRVTENHLVKDYTVDKIGKTVFFSKEEAKQALKKRH